MSLANLAALVDDEELRVRQTEMRLEQLRHQATLNHSDLQRRFVFALALAGPVFVSLVRAEVPLWVAIAAGPPLGWAWVERRRSVRLGKDTERAGEAYITRPDRPKPSMGAEVHEE